MHNRIYILYMHKFQTTEKYSICPVSFDLSRNKAYETSRDTHNAIILPYHFLNHEGHQY